MSPIYLDCHATTPVDPRVLKEMLPYFTEVYGNPASVTHAYGWAAEAAVKQARCRVAAAIGADPTEIIFTSGATESNNLALKGVAGAYFARGKHLVTLETEHRAVLDPLNYLETLGFEVTRLPVREDGLVDLDRLSAVLRPDTILVSVMAANNEIGVLQPLEAIGQLCHDRQVLFHTDGAQAVGKIPLNVHRQAIDLLSLTAHKIYGPKGIGALYVRRKNPRVQLAPQLHGGGQERGWRSGTLPVPQIVGFGAALEIALQEQEAENDRLRGLRDWLWQALQNLDGLYLNGDLQQRLGGNLNVSIEGVRGQALLLALQPHLAISSGSACTTAKVEPSHVLQALGRSRELSLASLRFGLGRFTTRAHIETAAQITIETVQKLRTGS